MARQEYVGIEAGCRVSVISTRECYEVGQTLGPGGALLGSHRDPLSATREGQRIMCPQCRGGFRQRPVRVYCTSRVR